jgi:tRNA modification GTPase
LIERVKAKQMIAVLNKCDCPVKIEEKTIANLLPHVPQVKISALHKQGIDVLEKKILARVWHGQDLQTPKILISNLRQTESLKKCLSSLQNVQGHLLDNLSLEFISEEVKLAVHYLDQITGKDVDADLLDKIFSSFCIGK